MEILPIGALAGLDSNLLALAVVGAFFVLLPGLLVLLLRPNRAEMLQKHGLFVASLALAGLLLIPVASIGLSLLMPSKPASAKTAKDTASVKRSPETSTSAQSPKPAPSLTKSSVSATASEPVAAPKSTPVTATPEITASAAVKPASAPSKDSVAGGKTIFERERCFSCHTVAGSGGSIGPDLTNLATRRTAAWVMEHFKDPQGVSPGTLMPKFNLPGEDFEALTAYLFSLARK